MSELLFIACNGHVAALDASTGQERWRVALQGVFGATQGQDVTILEHDGRVYAGANGHVFCLDAATGARVWDNELKGLGYNDVTLSIGGKSVQFVAKHTHSHTPR